MNPRSTSPVDEELAELQAGKTSAACAKIVARHGPLVMSACRRVLRDEGLAEDAAQETFVLLIKKARGLPPGTSLAGWLYHAACRTALNHQRTAMRRRVRENSPEAMNQMIPDTQPNLWKEIEPHLDEAMLALPDRQRDLVVQCYFQKQSQRSAAETLGCSESVVSRELSAALEALRQFFAKRRVTVSSVALTGLLSAHAATATMAGGATAVVTAMMATTSATTLLAALVQSKLMLAAAVVAGTTTLATVGYYMASPATAAQDHNAEGTAHAAAQANAHHGSSAEASSSGSSKNRRKGDSKGAAGENSGRGKWEASFQYTSAMALDEKKKEVLLESDPDMRYALLQKMGIRLSRASFDALIAKGMDASVAPWRDTFAVLANRTDAFDSYVMAWSNEDPIGALNWVAAQPDGGLGMRKQLLYALDAGQLQPDTLREWINGLTNKSMKHEAMLALESMSDPSTLIARMGTGDNEGFLVDLAMLHGGRLDWAAFGRKLATGKREIVARAVRQVLDGEVTPQHLDQMIQALAGSSDAHISDGAVTILRAAHSDPGVDYRHALDLATVCDQAGMSDFSAWVFKGWGAANPQAAVRYASGLKDLAGLRDVMRGLTTLPDEATLLSWLADAPENAVGIALTSLYGRTTDGTFAQLQKIMQSSSIINQVEAAKEVLRMIPLRDASAAAQWLKQLPAGKERTELATALTRRLAAVDPQATLSLVQSEGLRGAAYADSISHAVTQFAAQNDLAQSTQFIQQITDPKAYAEALGQLAMVKFPGHPQEAYAYLQSHSRGDWQPAALRMLSDVYYNKLGNFDANAAEILKLDLPRLGTEAATSASLFCKAWIDNRAPFDVPLAWTLQLPPAVGRNTRLQLAKNKGLKPATAQQFQAWARTATISPAERTQLLNVLSKRLGEMSAR